MKNDIVLEVTQLFKKYDNLVALDHLDINVKKGEIFGLLGPNASGKTTLINCVLSLLKYQEGTIKIFGKTMKESEKDVKRNIGVVMQDVAVFNELTVYENIEYFCSLYIKDRKLVKQYTEEAMQFVSIEEFRNFQPPKLSGGLLRRLHIACGIAHKPELVILDEPTVAVDPQSRNKILEGIVELNKNGTTIIYTTHYMEEVEQICTDIAIIDKGKVVIRGTKEFLKDSIATGEKIIVETSEISDKELSQLNGMVQYTKVEYNNNTLTVTAKKGHSCLAELIEFLKTNSVSFDKVRFETPTLNDVFLEITGKQLRD